MSLTSTAVVTLVLTLVQVISGLRCFQCGTTDPNNACVKDYMGFVNDSRLWQSGGAKSVQSSAYNYVKECPSSTDRCMIQSLEQDGRLISYQRGCHDGQTFSTQFENPRFHDLHPTNSTTCASVIVLACFTFCDHNLCNGPQWTPPKPDPCENVTVYDYDYADLPEGCNPWDLFNGGGGLEEMTSLVVISLCLAFCLMRK